MPKSRVWRLSSSLIVCLVLVLITRNLYRRWSNQALFNAVQAGDLRAVRTWLDRGADPDYRGKISPNATSIIAQSVSSLALAERYLRDSKPEKAEIAVLLLRHDSRRAAVLQSALVSACREGETAQVRRLLDLGASAETPDKYSSPMGAALDFAQWQNNGVKPAEAQARSREMVRILREHGACLTLRGAIRLGDVGLVRSLLDAGGDPNMPSSPVDVDASPYSQGVPTLSLAVVSGHHEVLDLLLAHGAKPNARDLSSNMPLDDAIQRGDRYALRALLAHGADPGRATSRPPAAPHATSSPLEEAVIWHPELIPDLLAAGADINGGDGAPLRRALSNEHYADVVPYLLRHGARADVSRSEEANDVNHPSTKSLLDLAVRNAPASFDLLLRAGADITPDRPTILFTAATCGRAKLIPKLVALGADVNAASGGETVLTEAVAHTPSRVKLLLEHGAKPNVVTRLARTPLILAVQTGNLEVARLLIAHGADVNAVPPRDHSALYYAHRHQHADLVALLQKAGATVDR